MATKSFLEQLRKEIASIQKELECTEAEAFYALRRICLWDEHGFGNREFALSTVKLALEVLEVSRKASVLDANSGDAAGSMIAVHLCVKRDFPSPEWLKKIVISAIGEYLTFKVKGLDDAFGVKRRYFRIEKAREVLEKSYEIYMCCRALQEEGVKIGGSRKGDGLFERVAKQFGMSVTKIKDYYYKELKAERELMSSIDQIKKGG